MFTVWYRICHTGRRTITDASGFRHDDGQNAQSVCLSEQAEAVGHDVYKTHQISLLYFILLHPRKVVAQQMCNFHVKRNGTPPR